MSKLNLRHLNKAQKQAVKWGDSPLMVIAGAGSGKTRVLIYRVARLLKRGYLPTRLWVTTFTTKAADEMRDRLEDLIGETKADRLKIGTFHSLCYRIYRDLLIHRHVDEAPRLIMGGGRWMTMVKIIGTYKFGDHNNRFATRDIKGLLSQISYWKNEGLRPKDIEKEANLPENKDTHQIYNGDPKKKGSGWTFTRFGTSLQAYRDYEKELRSNDKIDFDDMLVLCYWELRKKKSKKFLERQRNKLHHILVDEAQDLNKIQFMLVKLLAGKNRRITMVGDDYQVLYGFRGAKVTEIIGFGEYYNATIVRLEQNYRSTPQIVAAGNKLIKYNTVQVWKDLFTENESGMDVKVMLSADDYEEAVAVCDKIVGMIVDGYNPNDIAILYRTNAQSRAIVDEFILNHIPHRVYSKEGFYDRREVKDILAYLRICYAPMEAEMEDFRRIINRPSRFLGQKFIDGCEDVMFEQDYDSYWQAVQNWHHLDLVNTQQHRAQQFVEFVERTNKLIDTNSMTTKKIIEFIIEETGYLKWLNRELESEDEDPDNDTGMNLDALLVGAERFKNPADFLLFVDSQEYEKNEEDDAIHVLTVHKSKGMEWPVVFVLGVCEPCMPHYKAEDMEEERRIAYVAVTRAMEELYISTLTENFGRMTARPSRFIEEMGAVYPGWYQKQHDNSMLAHIEQGKKAKPSTTVYDINSGTLEEIEKHIDKTVGEKHQQEIKRIPPLFEEEVPAETQADAIQRILG